MFVCFFMYMHTDTDFTMSFSREVKAIQLKLKKLQAESNKRDAKLYSNMFSQMTKVSIMFIKFTYTITCPFLFAFTTVNINAHLSPHTLQTRCYHLVTYYAEMCHCSTVVLYLFHEFAV